MAKFKEISRDELKKWMNENKDLVLIDVLGEQSYEARHLPGTKNVPRGDNFIERISEIVDDKNRTVVVYCSNFSCQASPAAAADLVGAGYKNVYDYTGGLADWQDGGYEFEAEQGREPDDNGDN